MVNNIGNATVAICFSGLIRLGIPDEGASVRHNLVDALSADAFMAATYTPDDACAGEQSTYKSLRRCLLRRVRRAGPFVEVAVRPMLSNARLASLMNRTVCFYLNPNPNPITLTITLFTLTLTKTRFRTRTRTLTRTLTSRCHTLRR
jgi:hypothetical protein